MEGMINMFDIAHIGLVVKDVDKSRDFYCNVLGCEVIKSFQDERLKAVFVKFSNGVIEILQYFKGENGERGAGLFDHLAFDVEDVDKTVAELKAAGVKMVFDAPKIVMGGTVKIMFFLGPDGERLEIKQDL